MAAATSPLIGISDLMKNLAPIFLGSGTTTTTDSTSGSSTSGGSTSSSTASPSALEANQQVIDQATANSNDPAQVALIVNNIMTEAARAFAPTIGQQNSAGMYNSSTLGLLSAAAQGDATRQSAQAVLTYKTSQQQIAQAASGNLLQATKAVTTADAKTTSPVTATKAATTAPAIDPMAALLTAGSAFAVSKAGKALGIDKLADSGSDFLDKNVGQPIQDFFGVGPAAAADQANILSTAAIGGTGRDAMVAAAGAGADPAIDTASVIGQNVADPIGEIGSGAASIASDFAAPAAGEVASEVAAPAAEEAVSSVAADAGGDAAGDVASTVGEGWIVCTELMRQGRLPRRFWAAGFGEFDGYSDTIKRGYYYFAIPAVRHLRKHPFSLRSRFLCWLFNHRVEYLAARAGVRGAIDTLPGAICCYSLLPLGWIAGSFLQKEMPDWKSLSAQGAN